MHHHLSKVLTPIRKGMNHWDICRTTVPTYTSSIWWLFPSSWERAQKINADEPTYQPLSLMVFFFSFFKARLRCVGLAVVN